jgi:hypothetical protein
MEELLNALQKLNIPKEVVGVLVVTIYVWPLLQNTWSTWRQRTKDWTHYRTQLELLKLRCEIELLKRANNLEGADFSLPVAPAILSVTAEPRLVKTRPVYSRRFLFGLFGSLTTMLAGSLFVFLSPSVNIHGSVALTIAWIVGLAIFGGVVATPLGYHSRWHAFGIGATIPIIFMTIGIYLAG